MRSFEPAEMERRVAGLARLHDSTQAFLDVLACGAAVIPILRRVLLEGRPESVYQPRIAVAEALAALGAHAVLREYLERAPVIHDPVLRWAEEAVRNQAARMLASQPGPETRRVLLQVAERECLSGVIEALGERKEAAAAPAMIRCLEDDVVRRAAREALGWLGSAAVPYLVDSADRPDRPRAETPSSRIRRRECLLILREASLSLPIWSRVRHLVEDSCPEIAAEACLLGLHCELPAEELSRIAIAGLAPRSGLDWMQAEELDEALRRRMGEFSPDCQGKVQAFL